MQSAVCRVCLVRRKELQAKSGVAGIAGSRPRSVMSCEGVCCSVSVPQRRDSRAQRMLTARAARTANAASEIIDCNIINALPQRVSTGVSVGENAVLVLNARNR